MGINENLQPVTWAVSMPFVVITSLSCILRIYSRLCLSKSFGADDWFMVAASITWLATQAILGQMIVFGGGKQDKDVPPENLLKIVTLLFVIEFVYIFCQWLIKMSFLTFYLRVLSISPLYKKSVYGVMVFTSAQTLAVLLFYGLQCLPLDAFFHPEAHPDAKCIPTAVTLYFPASMNVLTDLLIYILPIYPLWTLQMSARRRVGLIACFTVGGSTIIVSLLRFIVLVQLASGSRTFYVYGSVAIVTTIELCTAIMTANMPSLRSVWRTHVSGTLYGSSGRKPSSYELGTTSRARGNRKMIKSSIVQRLKQGATNVSHADSEEELCRNGGDIVVSTQVNVSSVADPSVNSPRLLPSYYKLR
ncbi:hypothetical protein BDV41DRAFT_298502 [Aspergillus transmontanensis]|uniref:Rhodopsin domain-containing protein n=1 Tax=Aspergillus transmontanensis TaxID=1034304 RepID=A0A5N6VYL6_9EURO|nr:hypothetical protein BDV41DRAFT_298502 [Aspergillus transmontanensis]